MANGNFGGGDGSAGNPYLIEDMLDLLAGSLIDTKDFLYFRIVKDIDASGYVSNPDYRIIYYSNYKILHGNDYTIDLGNIPLIGYFISGNNISNIVFLNIRQCSSYFIAGNNIHHCKFYIDTSGYIEDAGYTVFGKLTKSKLSYCEVYMKCYGKDYDVKFRIFASEGITYDLTTLGGSYYRCKINIDVNLDYVYNEEYIMGCSFAIYMGASLEESILTGNVNTFITYKYNNTLGGLYYIYFDLRMPTLDKNSYSMTNVSAGFSTDFFILGYHVDLATAYITSALGKYCYNRSSYNIHIPELRPEEDYGRSNYTLYLDKFGASVSNFFSSYATDSYIHCNIPDKLIVSMDTGLVPDELLKDKDLYMYWDFDNIWDIRPDINGGYPYLRWDIFYKPTLFIKTAKGILNIPFYTGVSTIDNYVTFRDDKEDRLIKLVSPNSPDALPIRIMTPKGIMSFSK